MKTWQRACGLAKVTILLTPHISMAQTACSPWGRDSNTEPGCPASLQPAANNGIGISGIAGGNGSDTTGVRLMNCVNTSYYAPPGTDASTAFIFAADNGAAITSNSWGDYNSYYYREDYFADGLRYFSKFGGGSTVKGGVTIWAAGNTNLSIPTTIQSYDVDNNIYVAATDNTDTKAGFANYGDWIDISAPGVGVYTTYPEPVNGSLYGPFYGTSASAPVVSGVAALVASVPPGKVYGR